MTADAPYAPTGAPCAPTSEADRQRIAMGIALVLAGVLSLAAMDTVLKLLVVRYEPLQLASVRSIVALPVVAAWVLWRKGGFSSLRTRRLPQHVGRALVGLTALVLFTEALRNMAIADAIAIAFAAPLFMTALSVPLLREHVGMHRWSAVIVGFLGVLVIVRPGSGIFGIDAVYVLVAALLYALMMIWMRGMSRTESTGAIVIYALMTHAIVGGALGAPAWVPIRSEDLLLFLGLGVCGAAGHVLLAQAYRLAPVPILAPFDYGHMVWAVLFGYLVWGTLPDAFVLGGTAVVMLCGVYIVRRETMRKKPIRTAPATPAA